VIRIEGRIIVALVKFVGNIIDGLLVMVVITIIIAITGVIGEIPFVLLIVIILIRIFFIVEISGRTEKIVSVYYY